MSRVVVYHSSYGCDTGCCGHVVELDGRTNFKFSHPYGKDHRKFVEKILTETFGKEHIKDIDWDNCDIQED